jgi:CRISPR-associated protein Cas2
LFYLVSYDITDNSRRLKVAKAIKDFGDRVQYSVFECILDGDLLEKMMKRLNRIVKIEEDSIRIYGLCKGCEVSVKVIGAGKISKDENVYIL